MANAFINLLPTTPAQPRNVAETFLRARAASNQNALAREQIEASQLKNEETARKQQLEQIAPDVISWDAKWERTLEESGGDREKALAAIQPEWEAYVPAAREKGFEVTDTYDPDETKATLKMLRLNKIVGSAADNLSQTTLTDQEGNPLVYDKSTGSYQRGIVESGVKARPRQRPSKPTQTEKDRKLLRQEANKLFPDANFTEGEILIAGKNSQATGRSLEYELRKILKKRSPEAGLEKAEEPGKEPWYSRWLGGGKKKEQPAAEKPPKGAVDTGRTSGGKPVWELPTKPGEKKKYWLQSQAAPVNLAMNAEDVPLGTGMAGKTKSRMQLQKELWEAVSSGDRKKEEEIREQIKRANNRYKNVG